MLPTLPSHAPAFTMCEVTYSIKDLTTHQWIPQEPNVFRGHDIILTNGKDRALQKGKGTLCSLYHSSSCSAGISCKFLHIAPEALLATKWITSERHMMMMARPSFLGKIPPPSQNAFLGEPGTHFTYPSEYAKELECTICLNPWLDPMELNCGHIFCYECLRKTDQRLCPLCRAEIVSGKAPNRALRSLADSITVQCLVCPWKGPREQFPKHDAKCVNLCV